MCHALVNRDALDELSAVIGTEKLARILDRFLQCLATAFEGGDRAAVEYGQEAHTLVSMSGMLGCDAFSRACRTIEEAAVAGGDLAEPLAAVRSLRDRTFAALENLRADAARDDKTADQPAATASSDASKVRTAPPGG